MFKKMSYLVKFLLLIALVFSVGIPTIHAQETFTATEVSFEAEDHTIPAIITLPNDISEPVPVVVMLHGTASNKDEAGNGYIYLSELLAENGIASVRFDFAGSGDSDRDYVEYTISGAVEDTEVVLNSLEEYSDQIDTETVGVIGWSQGGYIAMLVAASNDIQSLVTWAGTTNMSDNVTEEQYNEAIESGFFLREYDWREDTKVSLQWIEEMMKTDVLGEFANYEGPVLAIHGSEDTVVPIEDADKIVEANNNEQSRVEIIESADHTFNIFSEDLSVFEQTMDVTLQWFLDTLN